MSSRRSPPHADSAREDTTRRRFLTLAAGAGVSLERGARRAACRRRPAGLADRATPASHRRAARRCGPAPRARCHSARARVVISPAPPRRSRPGARLARSSLPTAVASSASCSPDTSARDLKRRTDPAPGSRSPASPTSRASRQTSHHRALRPLPGFRLRACELPQPLVPAESNSGGWTCDALRLPRGAHADPDRA